jgi:hypothetical protein
MKFWQHWAAALGMRVALFISFVDLLLHNLLLFGDELM